MLEELKNPAVAAIPLYLALIWWEVRSLRTKRSTGVDVLGYERRDASASIRLGLLSLLTVGILQLGVLWLSEWLWDYRLFDLGNGVVGWAAAMIGWDFAYYWLHRFEHESRFFWAHHVNHHSSQFYNLSTALRQPLTPLALLFFFPPLALFGIRPHMIAIAGGFNLVYQFWIHTEAVGKLPKPIEFVFNTPSHHRVHHGSQQQYLDRNHGGILIIFDRMFGTFEPEGERVQYGLTKNIDSYSIWTIFSHELGAIWRDVRGARSWRDRWNYTFAGPGWAPAAAVAAPAATVASVGQSSANAAAMPEAPSSHVGGR